MTAPLAHAGHWIETVLYVAPLVVVALWVAVAQVRERRRRGRSAP